MLRYQACILQHKAMVDRCRHDKHGYCFIGCQMTTCKVMHSVSCDYDRAECYKYPADDDIYIA